MRTFAPFLAPLLGGCFLLDITNSFTTSSTSGWYETGPVRKPKDKVYDTVLTTLKRHGYSVPERDPEMLSIETGWEVQMSSHWRQSYRTMLQVELVPLETGPINIQIRSSREINDNAKNPSVASQASWVPAGIDDKQAERIPEPAIRLRQSLKLTFFGLDNG